MSTHCPKKEGRTHDEQGRARKGKDRSVDKRSVDKPTQEGTTGGPEKREGTPGSADPLKNKR